MINLIHPASPFLVNEAVMPPLGIMYLSSALQKEGFRTCLIDAGLGDEIPDGDLYISATTPQYREVLKLVDRQKYRVIGGPLASTRADELIKIFDCVVVGEGEEVIANIARSKPKGIVHTQRITNLNALPFPDRSTTRRYKYLLDGHECAPLITSRGCTGHCAFCCRAVFKGQIALRGAGNVLSEATALWGAGYKAVQFYDDSVAISRARLIAIAEGLGKRGLIWRCMLRADQVDPLLLRLLADSGLREVIYGVESGSQKILNNIHKEISVQQQRAAILATKNAGIRVKASVIVGLPGETWNTVHETIKFLQDTRPDFLDCNILSVYKGSDIYEHPGSYDIEFAEGGFFKGRESECASLVRTSGMADYEIEKARRDIKEAFGALRP